MSTADKTLGQVLAENLGCQRMMIHHHVQVLYEAAALAVVKAHEERKPDHWDLVERCEAVLTRCAKELRYPVPEACMNRKQYELNHKAVNEAFDLIVTTIGVIAEARKGRAE